MFDRARMDEEHDAALSRLLALGLEVAERAQARVLAAETPEAERSSMMTFTRAARSLRQTIALRAHLARAAEAAERQGRSFARQEAAALVERRKAQAQAAVVKLIWSEHEAEEAERLEGVLDELLDQDAPAEDFAERPLGPYIERLKFDLHLAGALDEATVAALEAGGGVANSPGGEGTDPADPDGRWAGTWPNTS